MRARALLVPLALILLAGCGGSPEPTEDSGADAPIEHPSDAPAEDATPAVETSGGFGADLEALTEIRPDDVDDVRTHIAEGICESDASPEAVGPGAFSVMVKRYGADSPEAGNHPDLVRLVVAHDCPDRAELAEEYLAEVEG